MKTLDSNVMEAVNGGSMLGLIVTETACFAMGASLGLVTFGFGFIAGVGCSMLVAYAFR